ncbi:MAG: esterase-like activity of phytase family protein [Phycisphaerales bacterium]
MNRLAITALVLSAVGTAASAQVVGTPVFLGQATFQTGYQYAGTTVGGLSGVTYDPASGQYLSISDDRSQFSPARVYSMTVVPGANSSVPLNVNFTGVTTLLRGDGSQYPALGIDPEGIALNASGNGFWVSNEGDASVGVGPSVGFYNRATGQLTSTISVNGARYNPNANAPANTVGIRNNLAFETLTLTPDASSLFTATENALVQDGPASAVGVGTRSRILRFDAVTGATTGEFLYNTGPVINNPTPAGSFATNGLVDMLALDNTHFLALERSFSTGVAGNAIRLYQVDLNGATDISGIDSLNAVDPASVTAVSRTLLLDFDTLGITLDNVEGLTLGPVLPDGSRMLVLVADNNFSATQVTQVLAFSVNVVPTPTAAGLLGIAGVASLRRRR